MMINIKIFLILNDKKQFLLNSIQIKAVTTACNHFLINENSYLDEKQIFTNQIIFLIFAHLLNKNILKFTQSSNYSCLIIIELNNVNETKQLSTLN
jgi:hypothetical protein